MKTTLEKLIYELRAKRDLITSNVKDDRARKGAYVDAICIAEELLKIEEQQISGAFNHGYNNGAIDSGMNGEFYFKKHYINV